ncbi:unnamed protein product [Brachionus calyciflorus]|uniref:Uncharacterized protein n=1 Tax=Brachionus calyciflorus TaxID=104777 RepID=A0A813M7W9_9BILA|nr:unnamed protein product [Brachionus calyciflorus]
MNISVENNPKRTPINFNENEDLSETNLNKIAKDPEVKAINYKNGRKLEPSMYSFSNYYTHREKLPQHYNPLLQFLDSTEVKFHNDNLYEDSSIGIPTRSQILKERVYHLPIIRDTPAERARFRRKLEETQKNNVSSRKKYDFTTYENYSSHYFLTGARFNRNDTIDSKILNKYGVFVHRKKPDLVYIKSNKKALESFKQDMSELNSFLINSQDKGVFKSKSVQVIPNSIHNSK